MAAAEVEASGRQPARFLMPGDASTPGGIGNSRVLVVDDQEEIHRDFEEILKADPLRSSTDEFAGAFLKEDAPALFPDLAVRHARSGEEAVEVVRSARETQRPMAVAFIDVRMPPGIDGIETVSRIRRVDRDIELVVMTAYADVEVPDALRAMDLKHKLLYIRKPFHREEIRQTTLALLTKWNVERELAERQRELVIGRQRLEAVLDATGDAVALYDTSGRLAFANRWYEALFAEQSADLKSLSADAAAARFIGWHGESVGSAADDGDRLVHRRGVAPESALEVYLRAKRPVHDERGRVMGDLYVYRDKSQKIEAERMKAEVQRLRSELETTYSFEGMVGRSAAMQRLFGLMKRALDANGIPILVRGESGTGKELVARCIHFNGPRRGRPFLAINCASVPEQLFESELFGHERGAFTGAVARRVGYFERADGGTLLLDEIGDMPPAMQAKLLRVLQEREIQRLGSTASIGVDVQIVAATNQDLDAAMREGRFREDLFYRIAAFPLVVPPLREHREDIPELAELFLRQHAERVGRPIKKLSPEALRRLLQHDWPGNIRELEGAIGRAVLVETGDMLAESSLPPLSLPAGADSAPVAAPPGALRPLAEVERDALLRTLQACNHNVTQAALALGIHRSTLHRKLQALGVLDA